jgi:mRNA interferase RelE/StbE
MWKIRFHPRVLNEDLPSIDESIRRLILRAIFKKLVLSPQSYGKPLRGELSGFWKLRVADHRVIYWIENDVLQVLIIQIGPRRDSEVYTAMMKRFKSHS